MANLSLQFDLTARREKNLRVLQSVDESIVEIIEDYSHVAVYEFDTSSNTWGRLDVEGSVFITRSLVSPFYSLIVLNKKGPSDFTLDLSTVLKLSLQKPYLMLRCSTPEDPIVFGIWSHNELELEAISAMLVRIAINKETPVAPPTPQAKANQLLSMLKPKKKDTSEINSPTALSPTATTLVLTTAAAVASTGTSNGTSTSASASASVTATLGVESKAATLLSALKIGSSAKEKGTENAPLNINNSNNNSNYNNTNSCSDAGIAATINHTTTTSGKAAQLLSILKSPSNNSSTKSATVTAPISANAVISCKIASSTQPIEQTNVAMDESRRAELMLKMIKPRNTSVEDLLTDVDIAAKVKEAATAPSATSTASTAADAKASTSSMARSTSTVAPVNVRTPSPVLTGSTKSAKSTSSKEDALMRIILQSTSATTAATTVSAASSSGSAPGAPSSLKSVPSSIKAPSPVPPLGGSLPPRPVTDRNQAGSPLASCLLTSNLRTASSRNLRSPSASPILAGIPGPGLSGSGNVSLSSPAPVSWASLSNNNIAAAASATTTTTSLAGGAAGGGLGGIGKSHSMGNISSTASSAPMLISPSDLLRAKATTPTFTPTTTSTR